MEGVRLERRALEKLRRLLTEAYVRTPPTISSKVLIRESLEIVLGLEAKLGSGKA